jgi:hypothetical protein
VDEEASDFRPDLFDEVLGISDFSTDSEVILANLALAGLLLAIIFLDCQIVNNTTEANSSEIGAMFAKVGGPLASIQAPGQVPNLLKGVVMLILTSLIYGFLEPGFGLNNESLVLVISLSVSFILLTYVFDGGQVHMSERVFGLPAAIRLFPAAILLSIVCVIISRVIDLNPGVVYGFIAAAIVLGGRQPDERTDAHIILFPMLAMIVVSLLAWVLIDPLRDANADGSNLLLAGLEGAAVVTFVAGIQGLLIGNLPITFLDGAVLFRFSKLVWALITALLAFLFFHLVLHQDGTLRSAADSESIRGLFILAAVFWAFTAAFWGYFKLRNRTGAS